MRAPDGVAEDHALRAGARFVVAVEAAAERQRRPQRLEVAARHAQHPQPLGAAPADEIDARFRVVRQRRQVLERAGVVADEGEVRGREHASRVGATGLLLVQPDEATGLLVRQRREQHRVDDAEDGGRAADAEAERQRHDGGVARAPPHLAERVAQVAGEPFDPADAVHVVDLLSHAEHAAELAPRRQPGRVGRQALANEAGRQQLEMGVDLERASSSRRRRASANASRETASLAVASTCHACSAPRRRAMTLASRSQDSTSRASWRRPVAVMA